MPEEKPITELLEEIDRYCAAATPGPWKAYHRISPRGAHQQWHIGNREGSCQITAGGHERDYILMASAREDLPRLSRELRQVLKERDEVDVSVAALNARQVEKTLKQVSEEVARLMAASGLFRFDDVDDDAEYRKLVIGNVADDLATAFAPHFKDSGEQCFATCRVPAIHHAKHDCLLTKGHDGAHSFKCDPQVASVASQDELSAVRDELRKVVGPSVQLIISARDCGEETQTLRGTKLEYSIQVGMNGEEFDADSLAEALQKVRDWKEQK